MCRLCIPPQTLPQLCPLAQTRHPLVLCLLHHRSVLVLGDRTPIGRVEEVFGPVATPFYALRYAGAVGSAIPASIAPGSPMFSVLKFSTFISPDELVGETRQF